MVEKTMVTVYK